MSLMGPAGASLNPEEADNFEDIEKQFAVKVVEHMSTYWAILEKMRGSKLRLTKFDDEIYEHFKKEFPDFDATATINEDEMKSKAGKERWRNFIMAYEKKIDDYNFGTMLRANPKFEYGEEESIFAVRMQFYAVEIVRNREGLNDWIYEKAHPEDTKVDDTAPAARLENAEPAKGAEVPPEVAEPEEEPAAVQDSVPTGAAAS